MLKHELAHTLQQQRGGLQIHRSIFVGTDPWFRLDEIRKKFGNEGVDIYFQLQNDPNPSLFPTEARLFEQIGLMLEAAKLMSRHEARGSALSDSVNDVSCCRYPAGNEKYYLNDKFWKQISNDPPVFEMVAGKRPSEAIRAIFEPGAGSVMECHTTMVAIRYLTELKRLGDKKFDFTFSGFNAPLISPYFSQQQSWSTTVAKLQSHLPDPTTPIPGLEDPNNKGQIRVRRPKAPLLADPE